MYIFPRDKANHAIYGAGAALGILVLCKVVFLLGWVIPLLPLWPTVGALLLGWLEEKRQQRKNEQAVESGFLPPHTIEEADIWFTCFGGMFVSIVILLMSF